MSTTYEARHRIACSHARCVAHGEGHWHQDAVGRSWVTDYDEDCPHTCCAP